MKLLNRIRNTALIHVFIIGLLLSVLLFELTFVLYLILSPFIFVNSKILVISLLPLILSFALPFTPIFPYIVEFLYPDLKNHFILLCKNKNIDEKWKNRSIDYIKNVFSPSNTFIMRIYGIILISVLIFQIIVILLSPFIKYSYKGGIFVKPYPKYFFENDTLKLNLVKYNAQDFFIKTNGIKKDDTLYILPSKKDTFELYLSNIKYKLKIKKPIMGKCKVKSVKIEVFPPDYTNIKPYLWRGDSIPEGSKVNITLFLSRPADRIYSNIKFIKKGDKKLCASLIVNRTIDDTIKITNSYSKSEFYLHIPIVKDKKPVITIEYPQKYHEILPSLKQLIVYKVYDDYGISSVEGYLIFNNTLQRIKLPDTTSFVLDVSNMFMFPGDTFFYFMKCRDTGGNIGVSDTLPLIIPSVDKMVDAVSMSMKENTDATDKILDRINEIAEEWTKMKMNKNEFTEDDKKELIKETEKLINDINDIKNRIKDEMSAIMDNPYITEDKELMKKIESLMMMENEVSNILNELPTINKNNNFRKRDPLSWKDELSHQIDMTKKILKHLKKKIYMDKLKNELSQAEKGIEKFNETDDINSVYNSMKNIENAMNLSDSLNMNNIKNELQKAMVEMKKINKSNPKNENQKLSSKAKSHIKNAQNMMNKEIEDIKTPMLFAFTTLLSYCWSIENNDTKGWIRFFDRVEYTIDYYYNKGPADPLMFIMTFIKIINLKDEIHTFKSMVNNRQYGLISREKNIVYSILNDIVYLIMMSEGPASNQGGGSSSMISMAKQQISLMRKTGSGQLSMDEIMQGEQKLLSQLKSMMEKGEGGKDIGDIGKKIEKLIDEMKGKDESENIRREIVKKQRDIAKHLLKSAMARYEKGRKYQFEVERGKTYKYENNKRVMFDWEDEMIDNYRKEKIEGIEDYQRRFIEEWH